MSPADELLFNSLFTLTIKKKIKASHHLPFARRSPNNMWFPAQRASDGESISMSCDNHVQNVNQSLTLVLIFLFQNQISNRQIKRMDAENMKLKELLEEKDMKEKELNNKILELERGGSDMENKVRYSISQEISTRFCCALLCCGYAIVHNEFTWSIYPYSSGLLCWQWGNR